MKHAIITFGCRVNQADSLEIEARLRAGRSQPAAAEEADLVIVNTCSVTAAADQGARQAIRRVARANPAARIVVTGCYASRRPDEVAGLPNVERIVANADKPRLVRLLAAPVSGSEPEGPALTTATRFGDGDGNCGAAIELGMAGRTAFTLRVQTGCDERCAYCIIPATRGQPLSVPLESLREEIRTIAAAGFKEIALTGVHLGSYGRDLSPRRSLADLLRALNDLPAAEGLLFRISSLEPMDCTPAVVDLVAASDRLAPHFHLPLQHASDRLLGRMRRPYTLEYFATLVDGIRRRLPAAAIGSDVIVGFPGETSEDFEQLATYLERSPLTHVHVFPYSDRPGTEAAGMPGKIPGDVVRERARRVRAISERLSLKFRESQLGTVQRALSIEDGSIAMTTNYLRLRLAATRARNEWIQLRVVGSPAALTGELVARIDSQTPEAIEEASC